MKDNIIIISVVCIFIAIIAIFTYKPGAKPDTIMAVEALVERANLRDALDNKIIKYNNEVIEYNNNLMEGKRQLKR